MIIRNGLLIKQSILFICLLAVSSVVLIGIGNQKVHAAYDGGRIIDNLVFLDARSMSANDVQNFLASKGGQIAGRSFLLNCDAAGSQAKQAYLSLGAPCGQTIPASQIIYYSAQVYGISPKVILATLQKEQSLVTSVNPTDRQYSQAMGYACPTSGSCNDGSNFFYQIDNGTWVLRFHMERARGNNTYWFNSSSWTCGTEKNFYKPNLFPNQNVSFYDEDGVMYRTHFISNAATSSMYCYTPHAYNNPQGLYGRAPYGTTGRYYSGSYNFVTFFETWFGTTHAPYFEAQFRAQSQNPYVKTGESVNVYVQYINTGNAFWKDDASVFPGYPPIRLASTNPINRWSDFRSESWLSGSRPNGTFTKVLEADGFNLAADQHTVQPGQIAEYQFTIKIPFDYPGGVYREHFQPIAEGTQNFSLGAGNNIDIYVVKSEYRASYHSQSNYPSLVSGQEPAPVHVQFKNIGNVQWYDDISVPVGKYPIHLSGAWPVNRWSDFAGTSRPNLTFTRVYESDGTTLASNQHIVNPGQIARFEFSLKAPAGKPSGFYKEYFQPIVEGAPGNTWDMNAVAWLGINNSAAINTAKYSSQSSYPTLTKGGSGMGAHFNLINSGNTVWYDDVSVPIGRHPVHLATSWPINRSSDFIDNWPLPSRPNLTFTRVYESDGTTLASNQHIVNPGQIARFEFSLKAPAGKPSGFYKEYFDLITEGAPGYSWNMNTTVWMGLNVN